MKIFFRIIEPVAEFISEWVSAVLVSLAVFFAGLLLALFYLPNSPLPDRVNPIVALDPFDQTSFLTEHKLRKVLRNPQSCLAVLHQLSPNMQSIPDRVTSDRCGIRTGVRISDFSNTRIQTVDTKCGTALRLGMWARHSVAPAAMEILNQEVAEILQIGSYNCRAIRTVAGVSSRMSEHATANAIDITGFKLADGTRITLKKHWNDPVYGPFLKKVRDGGCRWFNVTLSPDYNTLHADHFHFDQGPFTSCR